MLNDTLIRTPRSGGLTLLHRRGAPKGTRELSSWRLRLAPGETATHLLADEEMIVVLQEGRGTFTAGGVERSVSRDNVFAGRACALYVPPGTTVHGDRGDSARSHPGLDPRAHGRRRDGDRSGRYHRESARQGAPTPAKSTTCSCGIPTRGG